MENKLKILPQDFQDTHKRQTRELDWVGPSPFCKQRVLYFDVQSNDVFNSKTNHAEANAVVNLLQQYVSIKTADGKVLTDVFSIGIITPFRAQIALIKKLMAQQNIPDDFIMVDTVERYQGGAKDIIIISLAINSSGQMSQIISMSDDGVDRKLNVALTRAKEQLIILGDQRFLQTNPLYDKLIGTITSSFTLSE